jgi:hypothetical protein
LLLLRDIANGTSAIVSALALRGHGENYRHSYEVDRALVLSAVAGTRSPASPAAADARGAALPRR